MCVCVRVCVCVCTNAYACALSDLRVWRTNPGSVFDYDPAEDNIQSRSLHMMSGEPHPPQGRGNSRETALRWWQTHAMVVR